MTKSVFAYRNGVLCAEALPLAEIVEEIDTPFYCTSVKQIRRNLRGFLAPFGDLPVAVDYAVRANGTLAVIRTLAREGARMDVASAGELARALEAGVLQDRIVLSGKGKTREDVMAALLTGVARIKVSSIAELLLIEQVAESLDRPAAIILRVDAEGAESGGFSTLLLSEALGRVLASPFLDLHGLALAREEEDLSLNALDCGLRRIGHLARLVGAEGLKLSCLGLGAGPSFLTREGGEEKAALYARLVHEELEDLDCSLFFEPGQSLVRDARALVMRVTQVKKADGKTLCHVDANQRENMFSDLLAAGADIIPVRENATPLLVRSDLLDAQGQSLSSFDRPFFFPDVAAGDLVAAMNVGACGQSSSAVSGGHSLAPEILVSGARYAVVRRRVAVVEQMEWESCPDWLGDDRAA